MGYAHYVGRVGALAVALGIGTAVASTPGVAWADETGDTAPANTNVENQQQANPEPNAPAGPNAGPENAPGSLDSGEKEQKKPDSASHTVEVAKGVVVSANGEVRDGGHVPEEPEEEVDASKEPEENDEGPDTAAKKGNGSDHLHAPTAINEPQIQIGSDNQTFVTAKQPAPQTAASTTPEPQPAAKETQLIVPTNDGQAPQSMWAPEPNPAPASQPVDVITGVLATLLSPFASTDPNGPVESPTMWVLAAAARRQFGMAEESRAAATFGATGEVDNSLMMITAAVVDEEDAVFETPDPTTGAVKGVVVPPADPQGRTPTYTVTSPPPAGTLTFNRNTGAFTYTPTAAQRVLAGLEANPDEVTTDFTVTVRYGFSGTTTPVVVSVPVSPIDITDRAEIDAGNGATGIAVTNNRAYVTNYDDDTITVIDTINRTVVGDPISVGDKPSSVAVKPDGTRVYVVNSGSGTVSVIDTASRTKLTDIVVGANPIGIAISPSGQTVYVINQTDRTVSKISTSTNRVTGTVRGLGVNPGYITVSPNGSKIYVANIGDGVNAGSVSTFTSGGSTARTITGVGNGPFGLAVTPDSRTLYVASTDGKVTAVETTNYTVVNQFNAGGLPMGVAVSKDGSIVMVARGDGTLAVYDTVNHDLLTTVTTGAQPTFAPAQLALSPDGMELYVTDPDDGSLHVVSLVPLNQRPLVGAPVPGAPNPAGVITGDVGVDDPDNDPLVYTVTSAPGKGKVTVDANGNFTYTPTAAARHAASAVGAGPNLTTDKFTITVSDGRRGVVTQEVTVNVDPTNRVPTITKTVGTPNSSTGVVSGRVTVTDADRDVITLTPQAGTTVTTSKGKVVWGTGGSFTYTPTAEARHAASAVLATAADKSDSFTLNIDDGHGYSQPTTVSVAVRPANAIVDNAAYSLGSPDPGTGAVVGTVTSTDADGDNRTLSGPTTTTKGSVTYNSANDTFTYTPTAAARAAASATNASLATRTDTFTVTVADGYGSTDTVAVTVNIAELNNSSPINGTYTASAPNASNGAITGRVSATDPDGNAMTYRGTQTTAKGTVTVQSNGAFTYTPTAAARHAASAAGLPANDPLKFDTFTVTVSDGNGGSLPVTVDVAISPKNAAPANGRFTATTPNATTGLVTGTVTTTDADGDARTYSGPTSSTKGGAVAVSASGSFTYTPSAAARQQAAQTPGADTDTFTVTANDGHGGLTPVAVTVTISPNASPINGAVSIPNPPGANGTVSGTVTATDPNNDPLTYSGPTASTRGGTVVVNGNGTFTYTPTAAIRHAASTNGATTALTQDTFSVTVSDGRGGTLTVPVTVTVSPTNTAPHDGSFIASDPNAASGLVTGTVTSTDDEGDTRTYSGPTTSTKGGTVAVNSSGSFTYTPTAALRQQAQASQGPDTDTFTVTVNDGHLGGTSTVTVTVTIAPNDSPINGVVDTDPAGANGAVSGSVTATDPNNDGLTYSGPTASTRGGTVLVNSNGTFTYTPTAAIRHEASTNGAGPALTQDTFSVTVSDGNGGTLTVPVTINVSPSNTPPDGGFTASNPDAVTGLVTGTVTSTDDDGDTRTYSGPTTSTKGGTVAVNSDGSFTYTPSAEAREDAADTQGADTDTFTVTVDDGHLGGTTTVTVTVTIAPEVDDGPTNPPSVSGVPVGPVVVDSTGTKYQVFQGLTPAGQPDGSTTVQVIGAGGTANTVPVQGMLASQPSAIPGGGVRFLTFDQTAQQVRVVTITPAAQSTVTVIDGAPADAPSQTPNGTTYFVTGVPSSVGGGYGDITVTQVRPNGAIATQTYTGAASTADFGKDNVYYRSYIDPDGALRVLVFRPDGTATTTEPIVDAATTLAGPIVAGDNGTAYYTRTVEGATKVEVIDAATGAITTRDIEGSPVGYVVVGANGAAYQVTEAYNENTFEYETVVSRVDPGNFSQTDPLPGQATFGPETIKVADNGTAYVVLNSNGVDTLYVITPPGVSFFGRSSGASPLNAVPIELSEYTGNVDDIYISPDNKAYIKGYGIVTVVSPEGVANEVVLDGYIIGGPIVFSPDGSAAYAIVGDEDGAFIKNLVTSAKSQEIALDEFFALPGDIPGQGLPIVVGDDGTAYLFTQNQDFSTVKVVALGADGRTFLPVSFDKAEDVVGNISSFGFAVAGDKAYLAISALTVDTETFTYSGNTQIVEVSKFGTRLLAEADGVANSPLAAAPDGTLSVTLLTFTGTPPNIAYTGQVIVVDPSAPIANFPPRTGTYTTSAPGANGTVTGTVHAVDSNGDPLSYSGSGTTTNGGTYTVLPNGSYSYTPSAETRHDAAEIGAPTSVTEDSFTVTVSDGQGGTLNVLVTVTVDPINDAPDGTFTAGDPDSNGYVTGSVNATDDDEDTLTYSGPTTTSLGGTVVVNTDGTFTYTPSLLARQQALQSPGLTDLFDVTVSDGYGGTDTVEVQVTVAPAEFTGPAAIDASPVGNAIVGTNGNIYQVVSRTNAGGDTETFVRVYSTNGTIVFGDSQVIAGGLAVDPVKRSDGGISLVTFDPNSFSTTVTVVNYNAGIVSTTATTIPSSAPRSAGGLQTLVGTNQVKYLVLDSFGGYNLVNVSQGTPEAHLIAAEPAFASDGTAYALQYTDDGSGNLVGSILKIAPNGVAQNLTAPELTDNTVQGYVPVGGSVYVTTSTATDTEVLVFGPGATTATTVTLNGTPVGAALGGPDGSVYQLTAQGGDLSLSQIAGATPYSVVIPNTEDYTVKPIGGSEDGAFFLHLVGSATDRVVVVRPNGTIADVETGGRVEGNGVTVRKKIVGGDLYFTVFGSSNPEGAYDALVTSDGTLRHLYEGHGVIAVEQGAGGKTLIYMYDGTVFLRSSDDSFATYQDTDPIIGGYTSYFDGPNLQVSPTGLIYLNTSDQNTSRQTLFVYDVNGDVVDTIAAGNDGFFVGPTVFDDAGRGYVTIKHGDHLLGQTETTQVYAVDQNGATLIAEVFGAPATPLTFDNPRPAITTLGDGRAYLTTVTYDQVTGEASTSVHILDAPATVI